MDFREISIVTHKPTDLSVCEIDRIDISLYIEGAWYSPWSVSGTSLSKYEDNGVYTFTYSEVLPVDIVKVTLVRKEGSGGWPGISLSEIQVFSEPSASAITDDIVEYEPMVYSFRDLGVDDGMVLNGDPTPVIVKDIEELKVVPVGESFKLYVAATTGTGTVENFAKGRIYSCKIFDNGALVRDFIPCKDVSLKTGLFDRLNKVFYPGKGDTGFSEGATLSDTSITDGVARRVKRAYIGVGGVARPFLNTDIVYWGNSVDNSSTLNSLSQSGEGIAATSTNKYAFFNRDVCDTYDTSLTYKKLNGTGCYHSGATTLNNVAFFAGGMWDTGFSNIVVMYDNSHTRIVLPSKQGLSRARGRMASATIGNYAIFAGGRTSGKTNYTNAYGSVNIVDYYTIGGTGQVHPDGLSVATQGFAGTTVKDYAIFAGGALTTPNAFNKSMTRSFAESFTGYKYYLAATSVSNYALFGGGTTCEEDDAWDLKADNISGAVNVYDNSLTRVKATNLSLDFRKRDLAATNVDGYAIFAGGDGYFSQYGIGSPQIIYSAITYDSSLTTKKFDLSNGGGRKLAATSVGDYALFGGGYTGNYVNTTYKSSVINVFVI